MKSEMSEGWGGDEGGGGGVMVTFSIIVLLSVKAAAFLYKA